MIDLGPFEHLPGRYLLPARPREREAREAVRGARTPEAAWEALCVRGLFSEEFLSSPRRRFGARGPCPSPGCAAPEWPGAVWGSACALCAGARVHTRPTPPRLTMAVALAADAAALVTVEALVREYAARSAAWGSPVGDLCVWAEVDPYGFVPVTPRRYTALERMLGSWGAWHQSTGPLPYPAEDYEARSRFRLALLVRFGAARGLLAPGAEETARVATSWTRFPLLSGGTHPLYEAFAETLWDARRYRYVSDRGMRVGEVLGVLRGSWAPADVAVGGDPALVARSDVRFSEMPDPYEPLCAIYALGYQPLGAGPAGVCVAAPPLTVRPWRGRTRTPPR